MMSCIMCDNSSSSLYPKAHLHSDGGCTCLAPPPMLVCSIGTKSSLPSASWHMSLFRFVDTRMPITLCSTPTFGWNGCVMIMCSSLSAYVVCFELVRFCLSFAYLAEEVLTEYRMARFSILLDAHHADRQEVKQPM